MSTVKIQEIASTVDGNTESVYSVEEKLGDLEDFAKIQKILAPIQSNILEGLGVKSLEETPLSAVYEIFFKHPELAPELVQHKLNNKNDYPLICEKDYEFGYQLSKYTADGKMYYVKFYDLLLIDHDDRFNLDCITKFCEDNPKFLFYQHETYRGFHFICMSHPILYSEENAKSLQGHLKCDFLYILFSNRYGFKYRLTPKIREKGQRDSVSKFIRKIGTGMPHLRCLAMYNIYTQYLNPVYHVLKRPPPSNNFHQSYLERIIWGDYQDENTNKILDGLRKSQRLLENHPDHYVAIDMRKRTYYICYQDLMMIDLDLDKLERYSHQLDNNELDNNGVDNNERADRFINEEFDIWKWCHNHFKETENAIEIYKSVNGYHLFLIDRPRLYDNYENFDFMISKGCDHYYSFFTFLRGYAVRLNKKEHEHDSANTYEYTGFYGNLALINLRLKLLTDKHKQLSITFSDCPRMF